MTMIVNVDRCMNVRRIFSPRLNDCVTLAEHDKEKLKKNFVSIFPYVFIIFLIL